MHVLWPSDSHLHRHRKDTAGEGRGYRVQDDLLQHLSLQHRQQVERRLWETGQGRLFCYTRDNFTYCISDTLSALPWVRWDMYEFGCLYACRFCLSWPGTTPHPPSSWMSWSQWWAREEPAWGELSRQVVGMLFPNAVGSGFTFCISHCAVPPTAMCPVKVSSSKTDNWKLWTSVKWKSQEMYFFLWPNIRHLYKV